MKQAVFSQFLIFVFLCRAYLMLHVGPGPILPVETPFKAWPSRIRGRILPVLSTQQPQVVPLISSRQFSIPSKLNFISLSQTSIKSPPRSSHHMEKGDRVHLCFSLAPSLFFASSIPLVTAAILPSLPHFPASSCGNETFLPVANHSPVTAI